VIVIEALDVCPCLDPAFSEANIQTMTTLIDLYDAIHRVFCDVMFSLVSCKLDKLCNSHSN